VVAAAPQRESIPRKYSTHTYRCATLNLVSYKVLLTSRRDRAFRARPPRPQSPVLSKKESAWRAERPGPRAPPPPRGRAAGRGWHSKGRYNEIKCTFDLWRGFDVAHALQSWGWCCEAAISPAVVTSTLSRSEHMCRTSSASAASSAAEEAAAVRPPLASRRSRSNGPRLELLVRRPLDTP
jgi:hypothetical protein